MVSDDASLVVFIIVAIASQQLFYSLLCRVCAFFFPFVFFGLPLYLDENAHHPTIDEVLSCFPLASFHTQALGQ